MKDNERNLPQGIYLYITRPNKTRAGLPPPIEELATSKFKSSDKSKLQYVSHEVMVDKADSSLTIEFYPHNFTWLNAHIKKLKNLPSVVPLDTFAVLMSFEKIPTMKKFEIGRIVSDEEMIWKETQMGEGFFEWYVGTDQIGNRTGRWYMSIMVLEVPPIPSCYLDDYTFSKCEEELNVRGNLTNAIKIKLKTGSLNRTDVTTFKVDYSLRTYTSGCYFYSRSAKAWIADDTQVHKLYEYHSVKRFCFKIIRNLYLN